MGGWVGLHAWEGMGGSSRSPVRVSYPLLDAEMMQCEELLGFPRDAGRVPRIPRPVPRQRATREAGGRGVLPDPSFSILKAHLLTRRYAGCFRAPCRA